MTPLRHPPVIPPDVPATVHLSVPATSARLHIVRSVVADVAGQHGLGTEDTARLQIAVDEACRQLVGLAGERALLHCAFGRDQDTFTMTSAVRTDTHATVPQHGFGWQVLATLTDQAEPIGGLHQGTGRWTGVRLRANVDRVTASRTIGRRPAGPRGIAAGRPRRFSPGTGALLSIADSTIDGARRLSLCGELDASNTAEFLDAVVAVLRTRPTVLRIDCSLVSCCAANGLSALLTAEFLAAAARVRLEVVVPGATRRILTALGLADRLEAPGPQRSRA